MSEYHQPFNVPCSTLEPYKANRILHRHGSKMRNQSDSEKLLQLLDCIFWVLDSMTSDSRVGVDFPIVSTLESLVTEEVNGLVVNSGELLGWVSLGFDVS